MSEEFRDLIVISLAYLIFFVIVMVMYISKLKSVGW